MLARGGSSLASAPEPYWASCPLCWRECLEVGRQASVASKVWQRRHTHRAGSRLSSSPPLFSHHSQLALLGSLPLPTCRPHPGAHACRSTRGSWHSVCAEHGLWSSPCGSPLHAGPDLHRHHHVHRGGVGGAWGWKAPRSSFRYKQELGGLSRMETAEAPSTTHAALCLAQAEIRV